MEDIRASEEVLKILDTALYKEQAAYDFYTEVSIMILNPDGRKKFEQLAQDELRHRHAIELRYKKLAGKSLVFDPKRREILKVGDISEQTSALEAVSLALNEEKKAMEMYKRGEETAQDSDSKKMFNQLMLDEQGHYNLLSAEYQMLSGGLYWFILDQPGIMEE